MNIVDPSLFHSAAGRRTLTIDADASVARSVGMIRRARAMVEADRSRLLPLLTARRTTLCAHLLTYQQFKHRCIFDPVVQHGTASSRIVARTLKVECVQMGNYFGAYHARWSEMDGTDWPFYRRDMMETADVLLKHLANEHRAIRQLLTISDFYRGSPLIAAGG